MANPLLNTLRKIVSKEIESKGSSLFELSDDLMDTVKERVLKELPVSEITDIIVNKIFEESEELIDRILEKLIDKILEALADGDDEVVEIESANLSPTHYEQPLPVSTSGISGGTPKAGTL